MENKAQKLIRELDAFIEEALYRKDREELFSKIEQLKAVEHSIERLEEKNILVPEGLQRLKSDLAAEAGKYEESYDVLNYLVEELTRITKSLKRSLKKR